MNREFFVVAVQSCCRCDGGLSEGDYICDHCKGNHKCQHRIRLQDALNELTAQTSEAAAIDSPNAKTMAELITPRQLVAIRAICNSQRLDGEKECESFFSQKVKPEELSRKAASAFIDYLKGGAATAQAPAVKEATV
jgi:hypothetical protein